MDILFLKLRIYKFWCNFDTVLYQFLKTGTSDKTLIALHQLIKCSGSAYTRRFLRICLTCTKKCKINKLAFIAQNNSKVSYLFLPVIFLSNYQTTSLETQHCPGYQNFLPFTRLIGLCSSTFPWFSQVS